MLLMVVIVELNFNSWKMLNFQKFQLKWKILKHFTRPKPQATLRKLFSPPPDNMFFLLWNKNFLTAIYRNIQTLAFQVLGECSCWASRNGAVQVVFSGTNQKHVCWKICKARKDFWLCCWSMFFIMLSELRFLKWVRFFERSCIVKRVIFFASFCWLWDFLPGNLKLTYELQIWSFESFFSGPNLFFWDCLGRFRAFYYTNFKISCRRPTMVTDIFTQRPYH